MRKLRWISGTALTVALALPGAAHAKTRTVYTTLPLASQKAFDPTGSFVNAYFPENISIHKGDTVSFVPTGLHTIDMPASGGPLPLFSPTGKLAAFTDAAGLPFWFNGQPELGFTDGLFSSGFGRTVTKGSKRILSGVPFGKLPKPLKVRFPKTGTFKYFCDLHPGMVGTVKVRPKSKPIPSANDVAATVTKQVASTLQIAKSLVKNTTVPANAVSVGAEGKEGVSYFGMVPGALTVPAGTTVRFFMPDRSTEEHTATFGPGPVDDKTSYLGVLATSLEQPVIDARGAYPSEPPPAPPASMSPALHGNGFWNSGALDAVPASPLPRSGSLKFATPGVYQYVCLIHPVMKATITVQ